MKESMKRMTRHAKEKEKFLQKTHLIQDCYPVITFNIQEALKTNSKKTSSENEPKTLTHA